MTRIDPLIASALAGLAPPGSDVHRVLAAPPIDLRKSVLDMLDHDEPRRRPQPSGCSTGSVECPACGHRFVPEGGVA